MYSIIEMDRLLTQASCTVTHWVHVVLARAAPSSFFGPTTITHRGEYLQVLGDFSMVPSVFHYYLVVSTILLETQYSNIGVVSHTYPGKYFLH